LNFQASKFQAIKLAQIILARIFKQVNSSKHLKNVQTSNAAAATIAKPMKPTAFNEEAPEVGAVEPEAAGATPDWLAAAEPVALEAVAFPDVANSL
jgi:hypothetical protein